MFSHPKITLAMALTSIGLACMTPVAHAADGPVVLSGEPILLDKIITTDGKVTHQLVNPAITHDKVLPGSHLVFKTSYRSVSAKPLDHFTVVNPLPAALKLDDDGQGSFDVSVDNGKTFGKLANLTFTDASGAKRAAAISDVTTLKWVIPQVAPGASGTLEFHASVR